MAAGAPGPSLAHAPGPVVEACALAAGAVTTHCTFGLCLRLFQRG